MVNIDKYEGRWRIYPMYSPKTGVGEGIGEEFIYINYWTARTSIHKFWQSLIYSQRGNVIKMFDWK